MKPSQLAQEKDPEIVRQAAVLLERENQKLTAKLCAMTEEIARLKGEDSAQLQLRLAELEQQLQQRNRMLFGNSSERREGGSGGNKDAEKKPRKPQTGHGPREQRSLPIEEVVHELDEADTMCSSCGGALEEWAGQFEEADEVDLIERRFVIRRHKRKKYRCRCGALLPRTLVDGRRAQLFDGHHGACA